MTDGSRDGSMEQYVSSLQSGEIDPYCLPWRKRSHNSPQNRIVAYSTAGCKPKEVPASPAEPGFARRSPKVGCNVRDQTVSI